MSFRDDVDALAARHSSLEHELAAKTRELADAARVLEDARAKQRLPILDNIRVASPCTAAWDKMLGDERVRHCGDCNKNVYNLSGMTRDEAEALLVEKNGNLCVRYYQRTDGTILLADCTVGVARKRRRRLIVAGAAVLLAGGGAAARLLTRDRTEPRKHLMGEIAPVEPRPVMGATVGPEPAAPLMGVPTPRPKRKATHGHTAPRPTMGHVHMGSVAIHAADLKETIGK